MRINIQEADEVLYKKYPVLNHGYVSLVDYMGGDKAIEDCARISYGKGTRKISDTKTLIRYLVNHHHTSPLESTEVNFSIAAPIHVCRQIFRHRTCNFNEYSGRYSEIPDTRYEDYELQIQSEDNKQGRNENSELDIDFTADIKELHDSAFELYKAMLDKNVSREQARMHLPLNTYSYFTMKVDFNNLFKFLRLRLDSHAQWEVRQFANVMACLASRVAPLAFEAFKDFQLESVTFSKNDFKLLNFMNLNQYNPFDTRFIIGTVHEKIIAEQAKRIGMGKREIRDFWQKLKGPTEYEFSLPEPIVEEN